VYTLADDTYAELLERLTRDHGTAVPEALRKNINAFYASAPDRASGKRERKRANKIKDQLQRLNSQDDVQRRTR